MFCVLRVPERCGSADLCERYIHYITYFIISVFIQLFHVNGICLLCIRTHGARAAAVCAERFHMAQIIYGGAHTSNQISIA